MTPEKIKSVVEFALLTAGEPLDMADFERLLTDDAAASEIRAALVELENDWQERAMRLTQVADGYQFVSRSGYVGYLRRLQPQKNTRLSRPLLEVLAVIAYQQPVTRGDVEQVRGVAVSSVQVAALEELGWIEEVGRRETPGRPILYCTTKTFLNDLGVSSLDDLPQLLQENANTAGFSGTENEDSSLAENAFLADDDTK